MLALILSKGKGKGYPLLSGSHGLYIRATLPPAQSPRTTMPSHFGGSLFHPFTRRRPSWPMILNTVELGMPSSLAILRPVLPCERSRATSSRCAFTVSGRPSLTPRRLALFKPAWIASAAAECLNSLIASSIARNALPALEVSMPWPGIIRVTLACDKFPE